MEFHATLYEFVLAASMASLIFWVTIAAREMKSKLSVSLTMEHKEDPSLRFMTVAYVFYHLGTILLLSFVISVCVLCWHTIVESAVVTGIAFLASSTVPIFGHLFSRSMGDSTDDSAALGLLQSMGYLVQQRQVKRKAQAVAHKVNPKYLVKPLNIAARAIRPSIKFLNSTVGSEQTLEVFESLGVPMEYLEYHDSPLNLAFAMDLIGKMKEITGDPKVAFYAQSCGGNLESMGAIFFLLSRYCSLKKCYEILVKASNHFDTVTRTEVVEISSTSAVLRVHLRDFDAVKDHPPDGFYSLQGWYCALPNIKGLPHAAIKERISIYNWPEGTERPRYCEFEVHWVNSIEEGASLQRKAA